MQLLLVNSKKLWEIMGTSKNVKIFWEEEFSTFFLREVKVVNLNAKRTFAVFNLQHKAAFRLPELS